MAAAETLEARSDEPSLAAAAAHRESGDFDVALTVLRAAVARAEEHDRAAALFELGATQVATGAIADACASLTLALDVCNRSASPSDELRVRILEHRARCHRHNRDWVAARTDVDRALELAESLADDALVAQASFQASIVAEREGQWMLAKFYAERAHALFVELGDVVGVGKCLNNLGGLAFLLGKPDEARTLLRDSFRILVDVGKDVEAAYAVSSLAQVQLRTGEHEDAERLARRALVFIGSRADHRIELGNAQLVLGRAVLAQERFDEAEAIFADAERTLERAAIGERAAVWIAQGELAMRRSDVSAAASLFQRAAEALQDFHF